ncbi:MAG: hypothetical protein KTV68_05545 [Acidimicrobiia bacterium]|nr:hypothetical protein [Acidimicrobiia bacterium]MCY4433397.1 hypothetical protein [bacterium]
MSDQALEFLIAETADHRIGRLWLEEIRSACTEVTRRFDPAVYAIAEPVWSEGEIDELVQDVTTEQLLNQGQLDYALDVAQSIDDVRRLLRFWTRRELARRRRRTVVDRLISRLIVFLESASYEAIPGTAPARYRPVGSTVDVQPPSDQDINRAAASIRLLPTTRATGDRASPVFRSDVLTSIAHQCFQATGSSLSINDFGRILREALTSWLPEFLELGEEQDWIAEQSSIEIESEDTVDTLMEAIPHTDQAILYAKLSGTSDSALAAQLGVSRPTAAKRKTEAFDRLRDTLASEMGDQTPEQTSSLAQLFYLRLCQAVSDE